MKRILLKIKHWFCGLLGIPVIYNVEIKVRSDQDPGEIARKTLDVIKGFAK